MEKNRTGLRQIVAGVSSGSGPVARPFVIAEAGVNHGGNLELAKRLIQEAAEGGADAIKFQTYRAHTLAVENSPAYWDRRKESLGSQFELFSKYDKFWKEEYEELKLFADSLGIEFLSTAFDCESVDFLNDLMDVFKISSSDITNRPLIEYICNFKKPIILSTGASEYSEIDEALKWIDVQNVPVALMHCTLIYPTPDEHANLRMISGLIKRYPHRVIGFSDHTYPSDMRTLEVASVLGAQIIEKHFTHDKNVSGNDHYHSMDKDDLILFRKNMNRIGKLFGIEKKMSLPLEEDARRYARRSLVALIEIPEGLQISREMLTWKRPGTGISPCLIEKVVGRMATRKIRKDEILVWDMVS